MVMSLRAAADVWTPQYFLVTKTYQLLLYHLQMNSTLIHKDNTTLQKWSQWQMSAYRSLSSKNSHKYIIFGCPRHCIRISISFRTFIRLRLVFKIIYTL